MAPDTYLIIQYNSSASFCSKRDSKLEIFALDCRLAEKDVTGSYMMLSQVFSLI